jgi:transcription-repair coupling factor (superfamily II helicase)
MNAFPLLREFLDRQPDLPPLLPSVPAPGDPWFRLSGLDAPSWPLFFALSFRKKPRPLLAVAATVRQARELADDLASYLGPEAVSFFPELDTLPYEQRPAHPQVLEERFRTYARLRDPRPVITVASLRALCQKLPPPSLLYNSFIHLEKGRTLEPGEFCRWLASLGYLRTSLVESLGHCSVRGGIVDVFPYAAEDPVRVEFWGDTVESLRYFDVFSQRSSRSIESLDLMPMSEWCHPDVDFIRRLQEKAEEKPELAPAVAVRITSLETSGEWPGRDYEAPACYPALASLYSYLPAGCETWFLDLPERVRKCRELLADFRSAARTHDAALIAAPEELLLESDALDSARPGPGAEMMIFEAPESLAWHSGKVILKTANTADMGATLQGYAQQGYRVLVVCENTGQAGRLVEILDPTEFGYQIALGELHAGCLLEEVRLAVVTEDELFQRSYRKVRYRKFRGEVALHHLKALKKGDIVVHERYGIGMYWGLERAAVGPAVQDCLLIKFRDQSQLSVPVEDLRLISKYSSLAEKKPELSVLGGKGWDAVKRRTGKAVERIVRDLLALYAQRALSAGHPFPPDTALQTEFENSFVYSETPDQAKAITAVKADMEKGTPMDRLVCGDVGFGKTEVALRAAFKAVMDRRQVALLCPTTLLASQHYHTFSDRLREYPLNVEMLSRFRSPKQQKQILADLAGGRVDIIIGTHRLLSADVRFKHLGLLVVDEEHRFGVRSKEKIKTWKNEVDVLTLTATPIPRTLQLSLMGGRDMSLIQTPPPNRLPIQTRIVKFSRQPLEDAIQREIVRGGQVFFVHNRIATIFEVANTIAEWMPHLKLAVAHGQMPERQLEETMSEFLAGRYQVLVSTMIIESGLDLPNVNTIIIDRADQLGLAQLYQLRGRVGRSSQQAYAFLAVPADREITETAKQRLKTMEQFTDLGSGFSIALTDLEIRGAGNLLGTQQHGNIEAVGFELYCQLVDETVAELKGQKPAEALPEITLQLNLPTFLPETYIPDLAQRLDIYHRMARLDLAEDIPVLAAELQDRFGALPAAVENLMLQLEIKLLAKPARLAKITANAQQIRLHWAASALADPSALGKLLAALPCPHRIKYGEEIVLEISPTEKDVRSRARLIKNALLAFA